jgi:RimK family alpha-L-glutamate ligase
MQKRGVLVVNSFLKNAKFGELYDFLARAAEKKDCKLDLFSSAALFSPVGQAPLLEYDFCVFWDKDVHLCRALENSGLPCYNSSDAILFCDDKALTAERLAFAGIQTPKTLIAPKTYTNVGYCDLSFLDRVEEFLSYPMVIKERFGSFGAQVYLAKDRREAQERLSMIKGSEVLFQEYIAESFGRDLRINIVNGEMQGCMLRYNEGDFRSNISNGGKMASYTPDPAFVRIAKEAANAVGAYFAGVDVLFGKDGPLVCEVNASPHFKSTYEATGVDLADKILESILFEKR